MQHLKRDSLPLGGFAGLREYRVVTDSRVFGRHKSPETAEGLGNFVYLADAQFNPHGETGMHPHHEIDVISVMMAGRVVHSGSLEHGKSLETGDVQVQRAGGEGFSHNEQNPDAHKNRMIQMWVLPDEAGQPAGYQYYSPKADSVTRIYGGSKAQSETFDSHTTLDIARLSAEQSLKLSDTALIYITEGQAECSEEGETLLATEGDLMRGQDLAITAKTTMQMIIVQVQTTS